MRPIATDVVRSVFCVRVSVRHTDVVGKKRLNRSRCRLGEGEGLTLMGARNHVLDGVKIGRMHAQRRQVTGRRCGLLPN